MKIEIRTNNETHTTELSYMDLINAAYLDINSDDTMPTSVKNTALTLLHQLKTVLEPYSA